MTGTRGEIVVAWDERASGMRRVVWARQTSGTGITREGSVDYERAVYPMLVTAQDGVVLAWIGGPPEASHVAVRRLR